MTALSSASGRLPGRSIIPEVKTASVGSDPVITPFTVEPGSEGEALPPAVLLTLSTTTRIADERLVAYGRPAAVADTDQARMLDRRIAAGRKEVAAMQIRKAKAAARDARVLALLNPEGGLTVAKTLGKTVSSAMKTFGEAEKTIRRTEDDSLAEAAPEEVTAVAYDLYDQIATLGPTDEGRRAIDAALARLPDEQDPGPADRDDASGPAAPATLTVTTQVEALSIVHVEDDSGGTAREAGIEADRSQRMGQDAEVIKDGVSGLRDLGGLIAASTRRLRETGRFDAQSAREAADARNAWDDAVASTATAALPVVQAGYSIVPDGDA